MDGSPRLSQGEEEAGAASLPPPQASETQNILSFEGTAEEVLRYTIVAKVNRN